MRKILFRGKTIDEDCFVYGGYSKNCETGKTYIVCMGEDNISAIAYHKEVVPETVGQYTGLNDKNGKKIFEGDIVEFINKYTQQKGRAEIVFEAFKWKYSGCYYGGNPIVWLCIDDTSVEFEVIGNIHDNSELLEADND